MPTLDPSQYSGPVRGSACGCNDGEQVTAGPSLLPGGDACVPEGETAPENEPVSDESYQCGFGVSLQATVDRVNRITHELGLRPYRVFLVWQERNEQSRDFVEVYRLELTPVRMVSLDSVDLQLSQAGLSADGGVALREISPRQVSEDTLRGWLNGQRWGHDDPDREFFYEIVLHPRCSADPAQRRRRFIIGSEPHFEGAAFEFRVGLVDQEADRSRDGFDQSVGDQPVLDGPVLVT